MFVHDLNQFVLEETHPVLLPGKLCEDHGYSYEWVSGQIVKKWENLFCITDNFVPLVVPGLTTNSGSSSSSTTPSQESVDLDASQASGNGAASRSSEDSVSESRNEQAFGNGGEKSA